MLVEQEEWAVKVEDQPQPFIYISTTTVWVLHIQEKSKNIPSFVSAA